MWRNKYSIALIAIITLGSVGLYYGTISEHDRMLDAQADHAHEDALVRATDILAREPTNAAAIKVIKESGQIFVYLLAAQSLLADFNAANRGLLAEFEQPYQSIEKARALTAKAKALDGAFEGSVELDTMLDAAHAALIHVLARNAIDDGRNTLVVAAAPYRKMSGLIGSAASSGYLSALLSVQSSWAVVGAAADDIERQVKPRLDHMADTARLVSNYRGGSAQDVIGSLRGYIRSVNRLVAALSDGSGSYDDLTTTAHNAIADCETAGRKLQRALPTSNSVEQHFSSLIEEIAEYEIVRQDSTELIISQNRRLYES